MPEIENVGEADESKRSAVLSEESATRSGDDDD